MTKQQQSEQSIQNAIMRYLAMHDGVRVFRQNVGAAKLRGHNMVKFGTPGQGDLRMIVSPLGRLVEIEVKTPKGQQSTPQRNYQRMLEAHGGIYILARCVEDVWRRLRTEFPEHCWLTPAETNEL